MSSLDCGHNVSDLITIMTNEVLMYTYSVLSCSSSRREFHSPLYMQRIYVHLYWSWELVFFYSPVLRGYIRKKIVHLVQKYFLHDFSTDSILAVNKKKGIWWKKYQNETETRQRRGSVTVTNTIARKINTLLSLPIHWGRCQSAAASVVVSNPLDVLYILHQCLHCCCCSLCAHFPPPTPPSSL